MFNHFATLLVNLRTTGTGVSAPFSVPVDPTHVPVALPQPLLDIRRVLFGSTPDVSMLGLRVRQFTAAVEAAQMGQELTRFDSRIIPVSRDFRTPVRLLSGFGVHVRPLGVTGTPQFSFGGTPRPCDEHGKMYQSFVLTVSGGNLTVADGAGFTATNPGTTPTAVGATGYTCVTTDPLTAQTASLEVVLPVTRSFGAMISQLQTLGDAALTALFNFPAEEPLASYQQMFTISRDAKVQIAGVVLALAYQTELRRVSV